MDDRNLLLPEVLHKYRVLLRAAADNIFKIILGLAVFTALTGLLYFFYPRLSSISLEPELVLDPALEQSIAAGVAAQRVYIDAFYSNEPADLSQLPNFYVGYDDLNTNKDKLFRSGLLVMRYGLGKKQLSQKDYRLIKTFMAGGGRLLLLCPAWVYETYEKKQLADLSFARLAREFGLVLTAEYAKVPRFDGVFSRIICLEGEPVLSGEGGKVAAARSKKGRSRLVLWGQNNFFAKASPGFIKQILAWLFEA